METKLIDIALLDINEGQINDVPTNPRDIKEERLESLKRSIENLPDMLSMRELLVYPLNGRYVILGGNMRYRACLSLGYNELPCKVIPKETPAEKLRAIVIQDNNPYGETDWNIITNEWDLDELEDWDFIMPPEESEINIDDFFESVDNDRNKSIEEKVILFIPAELSEKKDKIKSIIKNALLQESYNNIKIK